jgi:hypothetical protein
MPASQLVSVQHGIIAWSKNADGGTAGLVVQTAILVRRSMEPTGRGAANNIGQPIPTVGVPATTTLNEGYWAFTQRPRSFRQRGCQTARRSSRMLRPGAPTIRDLDQNGGAEH